MIFSSGFSLFLNLVRVRWYGLIISLAMLVCTGLNYSVSLASPSDTRWEQFYSHNNRGVAYLEKKEYDLASEEFLKAIKIFPENPAVYINLGITHMKQGKHDRAKKAFKNGLSRSPDDPNIHYLLARIYGQVGQIDEQEEAYQRVIEFDPQDLHTIYTLAGLFAYEERYQEAIPMLRKILELKPESLPVLLLLGENLLLNDETNQALRVYKKVSSIIPHDSMGGEAYARSGQDHLKRREIKEGIRDFRIYGNLIKNLEMYQRSLNFLKTPPRSCRHH